ncbi:hypothetical protein LZ32DRAFT_152210 [Colletotrichum eremochloae]|nr:hypothetical protein LZ32DRAFT_152210 [Colletotrichum eremochloae]
MEIKEKKRARERERERERERSGGLAATSYSRIEGMNPYPSNWYDEKSGMYVFIRLRLAERKKAAVAYAGSGQADEGREKGRKNGRFAGLSASNSLVTGGRGCLG